MTALYAEHYRSLVRLAALLLGDVGQGEEVVQDSFVAMHDRWGRLREPDRALAYLRQSVVNRCRSALRHRAVERRHAPEPGADAASAEQEALRHEQHRIVQAAVGALPPRQREAVVLRYYLDLSEADTAAVMGISRGAAKSHTWRGMAALRRALEQQS